MGDQSYSMTPSLQQLFSTMTANYRPPVGAHVPFVYMGLPPLTIQTVDVMRRDPQVRIGMAIKSAPLLKPKFEIKGRPDIVEFVAKQLRIIWTRALPEILQGLWFTRASMEVIYKRNQQTGQIGFHDVKPIYPGDARVLTRDGNYFGMRVIVRENPGYGDAPANDDSLAADRAAAYAASGVGSDGPPGIVNLIGPKGFVYVHRREFGSWSGQSEFEGAYDPWLEKCGIKGAKDIRKLWMYKNAYHSGILFHPPGTFTDPTDPTGQRKIPYRDLARQAIEGAQTGQTWCFDNVFDPETKQRLWEFVQPQLNGDAGGLLEYPKELDRDILHGLEIPDDIVNQVSGSGGGFAGRTIPLMSFFLSQNLILQAIVSAIKQQILDPLCWINFESIDYEIQDAEVNIDALMPTPPGEANVGGKSSGEFSGEGDDNSQSDGGKVSDIQDVQGQPRQQKQLSQGVIQNAAELLANGWTPDVTVEVVNWKSRVIQFSQKPPASRVANKSGTGSGSTGNPNHDSSTGQFTSGPSGSTSGVSPDIGSSGGGSTPGDVLKAIQKADFRASSGALVSARDIHKAAGLPKKLLDRILIDLFRQGKISLHRHDYVSSLTDQQREELIHDPEAENYGHSGTKYKGTFYVGAAIRQSR